MCVCLWMCNNIMYFFCVFRPVSIPCSPWLPTNNKLYLINYTSFYCCSQQFQFSPFHFVTTFANYCGLNNCVHYSDCNYHLCTHFLHSLLIKLRCFSIAIFSLCLFLSHEWRRRNYGILLKSVVFIRQTISSLHF